MIIKIQSDKYNSIKSFLEQDIGRNYFILLGLASKKKVFENIYGEYDNSGLKALLFKRKSGTLQFFAPGEFHVEEFVALISTLNYNGLIGPRSYCHRFLNKGIFTSMENGAYISKLDRSYKMKSFNIEDNIRNIEIEDLYQIVELYEKVFKSFSSLEVMEEKLTKNRGRGICIEEDGRIISVAQTDFETGDGAVIVGVATDPGYQHKKLATKCLQLLCKDLLKEGKNIYLQYDNLEAGKIYERLGFKPIDQVVHYEK